MSYSDVMQDSAEVVVAVGNIRRNKVGSYASYNDTGDLNTNLLHYKRLGLFSTNYPSENQWKPWSGCLTVSSMTIVNYSMAMTLISRCLCSGGIEFHKEELMHTLFISLLLK